MQSMRIKQSNRQGRMCLAIEEARQIAKHTYRKARASREELKQRMSVLLPTKSPEKQDSS